MDPDVRATFELKTNPRKGLHRATTVSLEPIFLLNLIYMLDASAWVQI